ncbi:MAG: AlkZ-related protein [Chloroflexota bacterium]
MANLDDLHRQRLERWGQTLQTCIADPGGAADLIRRVGLATLFPASPEVPNLFHAYTGDPAAQTQTKWNSPAGRVYGWRWALGRPALAFYTAIVRGRPTWVSWDLLPAVLRLCGELRAPETLHAAGALSAGASRIAQVLADCGGVLSTGDLRALAGYPTGKAERAAYLRAIAELDRRLLLAKVFAEGDDDMRHALVTVQYPQHVAAAERLSREAAMEQLLKTYLPNASYALPVPLAKHLTLPEAEVRAGLERLVEARQVAPETFLGQRATCYVWIEQR